MTQVLDHPARRGGSLRGRFHPNFSAVAEQFVENFDARDDLGAACAVYQDGALVVDVWGGMRHLARGLPWQYETRVLVFSCSKGLISLCAAVLVAEGALHLDERVAAYWPEFAANGKQEITVRMVLNHTAGLSRLPGSITIDELMSWPRMVEKLEHAAPLWAPGEGFMYHAHTMGFLAGELIRRVAGQMPNDFLRERVCQPLGVDLSFGTSPDQLADLARIEPPLPATDLARAAEEADRMTGYPHYLETLTMNGALPFPGYGGDETYNDPSVLTAQLPAANLVASARDLATAYSAAVISTKGVRIADDSHLRDMARWASGGGVYESPMDPALRWGTGFMLDSPPSRLLLGARSFGHDGAGGSLAFADLDRRLSFAYTTNQMGGIPDDRANALVRSLRRSVFA